MKTEDRKKLGKKTRKEGKDFEARTRKDLTEKGWTVCRFDNDVQFVCKSNKNIPSVRNMGMNESEEDYKKRIIGKLVQAKTSWRRTPHGMFPMNLSPGFVDFICFRQPEIESIGHYNQTFNEGKSDIDDLYEVIGVESKINGTLDKLEKQKCQWLLDNNIFSKIFIASKHKIKNRIHIEYKEYGTR